jgi:hypothetical protein
MLFEQVPAEKSTTLTKLAMRLIFKFAGEPQDDTVLNAILRESGRPVQDIDDAALSGDRDRGLGARSQTPDPRPQTPVNGDYPALEKKF